MSLDRPIRWGIIGTGGIAAAFATDLALLPDAEIVAVGSRTGPAAAAFAERFGVAHCHVGYASLAADPEVDAVYVATPHPSHHHDAMLAISAGKAVLVEKPFTVNGPEAREVVAAARARGTFLMEAMWTRFLPHVIRVRELVAEGRLGQVRSVIADFGEWFAPDPAHRAYAPDLAGGALLDLGVYPVSFASMIFGPPVGIAAVSHPAITGVDAQTAVVLKHGDGELAVLFTTLEAHTASTACINGTDARIEIDGDFLAPANFRLVDRGGATTVFDHPHEGRGLRHQVAEVHRCLRAGFTESPLMPLDETLSIMDTLDEVRSQIGLRYPMEDRGVQPTRRPKGTRSTRGHGRGEGGTGERSAGPAR